MGAIADPDSPTVITNTAIVNSTGLGPWDPAAESFVGDVQAGAKTARNSANSFLPLPADEADIVKTVAPHQGACDLLPTHDPDFTDDLATWQQNCSQIDFEGSPTFLSLIHI